ncbi:MAG: MBL fold metallo-hydrolase [FCB group bacterium]|jgi:glyoxylase-like metal-dependent hydrolase (beta-lactamase superfamily II)|nr:MBL fold metallo-hydrolase [FCB group bacterium]
MSETTHPDIVRIVLPTPFPVGGVNAFLIKGDPLTLVDCGTNTEEGYAKLVAKLAEHGFTLQDIEVILITHGHLDHMGLLGRILDETNAQAYAHRVAVERSSRYDESHDENVEFYIETMRECGVPEETVKTFNTFQRAHAPYGAVAHIQNAVEEGDTVGPYQVIHVPGHSPSDVLFFDPKRQLAFTGDHVLKGITPNPILRRPTPGQPRPKTLIEYVESLRRTHTLDLAVCYPGHGSPITDHRAIIDVLFERVEDRTARILDFLEAGPMTPHDVTMALFPKIDTKQYMLGLSVAIGHLELLEQRDVVQSTAQAGVTYYNRLV